MDFEWVFVSLDLDRLRVSLGRLEIEFLSEFGRFSWIGGSISGCKRFRGNLG